MGVDRGVPGSSSQVLALPVRDVFAVPLDVPLRQSEIQKENLVGSFVQSNTEVVRLDISVDEMSVMDVLDPCDHLVNQHQHRLQRKLPQSLVEQGFQRWTHQIHHQI